MPVVVNYIARTTACPWWGTTLLGQQSCPWLVNYIARTTVMPVVVNYIAKTTTCPWW